MNNEPVAWMYERFDGSAKIACAKMNYDSNVVKEIPLYTHPAKTLDKELLDKTIIDQQNEIKELRKNIDVALMIVNEPAKTLTDEEILNLFEPKYDVEIDDEMLIDFARAILRKAQEK